MAIEATPYLFRTVAYIVLIISMLLVWRRRRSSFLFWLIVFFANDAVLHVLVMASSGAAPMIARDLALWWIRGGVAIGALLVLAVREAFWHENVRVNGNE